MTKKELQALRVLIDRARRQQLLLPMAQEEHWHGTETGYRFYKCRCSRCRVAANFSRNERRKRLFEADPTKYREADRLRMARYRARRKLDKERYERMKDDNNRASRVYRARKRAERNATQTV